MSSLPQTRRWISAGVLFGLIGSIATHGSIILAILFLFLRGGGGGSTGTNGSGGGEDGHEGAGDTSIDVSLASPATTAPTTATETPPTPTPPIVQPPTPPVVQEKADPDDVKELPPLPKEIPALPTKPESANGKDETTNGGKLAGPTRIGMPGGNGGGSGSGNGFGADSISGQRAILPKAAFCKDPVSGFWEALKYNPLQGSWVHFKLTVRREGANVHGTILSRIWSGSPRDITPRGCDASEFGSFEVLTSMNASGSTNGVSITFGASHATTITQCGPIGEYFPDRFSGTVDESRQEFQSLNNDGAADINMPYVFRRTGCLDE